MKRIAFFVEGQTEQIFVNRLICEILNTKKVTIIQKQFRGGINVPKQEIVRSLSLSKKPQYEVLIFDCGSDNRVKSEIIGNIVNLKERGYSKIVGMRDLYPLRYEDFGKLEKGLKFMPNHLKNYSSFFDIIIAVHEIEAWFLGEVNHFKKIDKRLTGDFIQKQLGFNPFVTDSESRIHPAKDMDDIYRLVGKSYTKRYEQIMRIVSKMNFEFIMNNMRYKIEPLNRLITIIEEFKG